jgi:DNA polymerase-4
MRNIWGGIGGERYAAWLRGEEVELPATQHRSLGHSHVLEPAMRNRDGAYRVAKRLTAKAAIRLRKMGYWAAGFAISVQTRQNGNWGRFTKLPDTQDTPTFLTLLSAAWQEFPEDQTPTWIGVTLAPLVPPQRHTLSLFTDDKREKLSHAMDQINNRFGKNTTYYANLFDIAGQAPTRIAFTRVPDLSEF